MQSLLEFQQEFAGALLAREAGSRGVAAYRANVSGNWGKALANAYPIVRKILGEAFFDAMAREYARAHPSASGDLNRFGARLANFVAQFEHTRDLPYLPDVARMEWLAHLAYYAADVAPASPTARELHASTRLQLAPGCALLASDWPLARLWEVHQDGYQGDIAVDFDAGLSRVLIHRARWRAQVSPVELGEYRFLGGALRGEILGDALEAAAALDPAFDPSTVLARWVMAGAVSL